MDPQVSQQIEQTLRQQWQGVSQQILERFSTVSRSDIDSARSADDLVRRISDKTHYSERFVETQLTELALSGVGVSGTQQSYPQSGSPQQPMSTPSFGGSGS